MSFENFPELKDSDFLGVNSIQDLYVTKCESISEKGGVYIVFRNNLAKPEFLENSIAGLYKGESLSVGMDDLIKNWVDDAKILYIGKAGGTKKGGTPIAQGLKKRIRKMVNTGFKEKAQRRGGKLIWQLEGAQKLFLGWIVTTGIEPVDFETQLKNKFRAKYGKLPFANLI
jgi:hypothetical protein